MNRTAHDEWTWHRIFFLLIPGEGIANEQAVFSFWSQHAGFFCRSYEFLPDLVILETFTWCHELISFGPPTGPMIVESPRKCVVFWRSSIANCWRTLERFLSFQIHGVRHPTNFPMESSVTMPKNGALFLQRVFFFKLRDSMLAKWWETDENRILWEILLRTFHCVLAWSQGDDPFDILLITSLNPGEYFTFPLLCSKLLSVVKSRDHILSELADGLVFYLDSCRCCY